MNLYGAKVTQQINKRYARWRRFVVRADSADDAWKAVEAFLNDEPFDKTALKPFVVREVAAINGMVHEVT